MSHHGLLIPEFTFTPIADNSSITRDITVACTMYSAPLVQTMEERTTVSGNIDPGPPQTSLYGTTVTDFDNKVALGSDSFNWTIPEGHITDPGEYVINWKYQADRTQENQMKLIKASAEFKNMMSSLYALQLTHDE